MFRGQVDHSIVGATVVVTARRRVIVKVGGNPAARVDDAIAYWPRIQQFLRQDLQQPVNWQQSLGDLRELVAQAVVATEASATEA